MLLLELVLVVHLIMSEVEFPVNAIVDGSNNPVASATMKIGNIVVSDTGAADVFLVIS